MGIVAFGKDQSFIVENVIDDFDENDCDDRFYSSKEYTKI